MNRLELTPKEQIARGRVCLALDGIENVDEAFAMANDLKEYVGMVKVGKELHLAAGNEGRNIVRELSRSGMHSFLDLKLHDTPATVEKASRQCAVPGVYMFNVHVAGGEAMCRKAVDAVRNMSGRPKVIGVTVLTSLDNNDLSTLGFGYQFDTLVKRNTELAQKWGLDGVVCPANKAGMLEKEFGSNFLYVTPGISYSGKQGEGQKQLYTPDLAVRDCKNSILVIGSAITKAPNRRQTAYEILQSMAREL